MKWKLYRDTIHIDIDWDELAILIIDTPEFQRLDGTKQLGFAYLGYRGAKHSRWEHSVGTYYLAPKILDYARNNHLRFGIPFPYESLNENFGSTKDMKFESIKKIVSYAALLHDISHVPFGHTLEDEFNQFYVKHDDIESTRAYHILFDRDSKLAEVFDKEEPYVASLSNEKLRRLIFLAIKFKQDIDEDGYHDFIEFVEDGLERIKRGRTKLPVAEREVAIRMLNQLKEDHKQFTAEGIFHPFMSDLFSNTICADLLDYVLRDAHGTGLQGLDYDKRIFKYFIIAKDSVSGQLRLALKIYHKGEERMDIVDEILKIMRLRYYLARKVYYYKSKVSASTMMCAVLRTIGAPSDTNPYEHNDRPTILAMTDDDLLDYMKATLEKYSGEDKPELLALVKRLADERKLYKPCLKISYHFASRIGLFPTLIGRFRQGPNALQNRIELEKELSKAACHKVFVYCPPPKMQAKEVDTLVSLEKERTLPLKLQYKYLTVASEVEEINRKYRELWNAYVFMHPDDLQNEILVSQVITHFCRVIGMSIDEAKEVAPYGFKADEELREKYLREWWKKTRKWIPPDAFDDVETIVKESIEWISYTNPEDLKTNDSYFEAFDRIFVNTQLDKYLSSNPKVSKKQKAAFREYMKSRLTGEVSEWMIKIESSFAREMPKPISPSSAVFHAAFEDFERSHSSLDRYTKKKKENTNNEDISGNN